MLRTALLAGLALLAAPRGAEAQTAGLRQLTFASRSAGCVPNSLAYNVSSSVCMTGGYFLMYDANGNILGTSKVESEEDHCEHYGLVGTTNSEGSTMTSGSLLLFDHEGDNYTATYTGSNVVLTFGFAPTCSVTFSSTTTTQVQTAVGSRVGTVSYVSATTGCPVDSCITSGYYYLYDGHAGLGLVPLSTNTSDGCAVILAEMGSGATPNGGTYAGMYIASNSFPELILEIDGGITGTYDARRNSFTMVIATPGMATALGVNQGCTYNFAFTASASAARMASSSLVVALSAAFVAVYAAVFV